MIDVSKAVFTERFDNDVNRNTEMYFDLPESLVSDLAKGKFKEDFEAVLKEAGEGKLHAELQLKCPFGERFETLGSVELGIGVSRAESTEVYSVVSLLPGIDFEEKEALRLWRCGI